MKFEVTPQSIPEVLLIKPNVYTDDRGYFKESYNLNDFEEFLPGVKFVQKPPFEQAKLVRVIEGEIFDVAVDIRPDSPTLGRHVAVLLSAENHHQLYLPRGFAHAFLVTSDTAIVQYKTDNFYEPTADAGLHPHDTDLNIPWPLPKEEHFLSQKDMILPFLKDLHI